MPKPYRPQVSIEQLATYEPSQPDTHTSSPLLNAVVEAILATKAIECGPVADYLALDARKLSAAVEIETGMPPRELIQRYRLVKIRQFIAAHPDTNLDEVARANGYASDGSLWRFFQRKLGETPYGAKSEAGPENYNVMKRRSRYGK